MTVLTLVCSALLLGAEMVIDVPEGTVVTNAAAINAVTAGDVLVKTGKGTWYNEWQIGGSVNFSMMEIREGTFENACRTGFFTPPQIVIRDGATLKQINNASYNNRNVTIQIDKGGTFNDWCTQGRSFTALKDVTGEGTFINYEGTMIATTLPNFTGDFILSQNKGGQIWIGDGASAANDPDLGRFGSFKMAGQFGSGRYPEIRFQNVSPLVVTNRFWGLGQFQIEAGTDVTMTDFSLSNGASSAFSIYGALKVANGHLSVPTDAQRFKLGTVNARIELDGGYLYGQWPVTRGYLSYSRLKFPNGSMSLGVSKSGYGTRILRNGAEYWTAFQQPFRTEVYSGASLVCCGGGFQIANAKSATEPISLLFDGGTMRIEADASGFGTDSVLFEVGAGGWLVDTVAQSTSRPDISFPTGFAITDSGSDGLITFRGAANYKFSVPFETGGAVTFDHCLATVNNKAAFYADGAKPFGRGDLTLGSTDVYSYVPKGSVLRLANGSGAKLRLKGSAVLYAPSATQGTDWEIGPSDATSASIVREKGTGLFLAGTFANYLRGGVGSCVIHGGVPLGANGKLPAWPLLVFDKSSDFSGDTWGGQVNFLTCDASGNVAPFAAYETTLGNDSTAVVYLGSGQTLSEDKAAAALCIGKGKTLTIPAGRRLTLGTGTDTASLLLDNATVSGAGTIDFGAAEGVIVCQARGAKIFSPIAGSGGVTYLGHYFIDMNASSFYVSGANTYSGGTYVSYRVSVLNDSAFGTDDVWVLGGWGRGGQIYFEAGKDKRTIANNLHIAGRGWKRGNTVGGDGNVHAGAIWARSSAELAGDVELTGPTRVLAEIDTTELKFSGTISGDSFEIYNFQESIDDAGTVVFTRPNAYTGGTEVVRSTLVLKPGATAGTGEIVLDGGNLVLQAPKDGLVMANDIRGSGTVTLGGAANAAVRFKAAPANDPFFQQEHVLDVGGDNRVVNSLAGFTSIVNSTGNQVHLSVLEDAEGSFTGSVDSTIQLHYGFAYVQGFIFILR